MKKLLLGVALACAMPTLLPASTPAFALSEQARHQIYEDGRDVAGFVGMYRYSLVTGDLDAAYRNARSAVSLIQLDLAQYGAREIQPYISPSHPTTAADLLGKILGVAHPQELWDQLVRDASMARSAPSPSPRGPTVCLGDSYAGMFNMICP
jgi:hypothetical protein